jgi:effector-binding domain-containing protein
MAYRKLEKGLLIFKSFLNSEPIRIEIKFTISVTSTHTINYKSTSTPKEKYASV